MNKPFIPAGVRRIPKLRPITTPVADVTDAEAFPEIAKAREYLASLPPERREQLEREWEG